MVMSMAKKEESDLEPGLSQMSALTALPSTQESTSQRSVREGKASGSRKSASYREGPVRVSGRPSNSLGCR